MHRKVLLGIALGAMLFSSRAWGDEESLYGAIGDGDVKAVQKILAREPGLINTPYCEFGGEAGDTLWLPLSAAAHNGDVKMIKLLLSRGAKVNAPHKADEEAEQPLHAALRAGHGKAAEFLLANGARPDARGVGGMTAREAAIDAGKPDMLDLLARKAGVSAGPGDMLLAAINSDPSDIAAVRRQLSNGADPNAACGDWNALCYAAMKNDPQIVRLLLDSGADAGARARKDAPTALHYAALNGDLEVARLLVDRGADVDAVMGRGFSLTFNAGMTPLDVAAYNGQPEVLKLLLARGAKVKMKELRGKNPWGISCDEACMAIIRKSGRK